MLRVAARHQLGEPAETLLGPLVEDARPQHLHVLLVYADGLLLERKRFLIEGQLELLQLRGLQVGRPLRLRQRATEIEVGLGHVDTWRPPSLRRFRSPPAGPWPRSCRPCAAASPSGWSRTAAAASRPRSSDRAAPRGPAPNVPQASGCGRSFPTRRPRRCVRFPSAPGDRATRRAPPCRHLGDLEAGFQGRLDRPRKLFDVADVRIQRAVPRIGLLVEVSRDEQRLAAQGRIVGLGMRCGRIRRRRATARRSAGRRWRSVCRPRAATRAPGRCCGTLRARSPPPSSPAAGSARRRRRTRPTRGWRTSARPSESSGSGRRPRDSPRASFAASPCL